MKLRKFMAGWADVTVVVLVLVYLGYVAVYGRWTDVLLMSSIVFLFVCLVIQNRVVVKATDLSEEYKAYAKKASEYQTRMNDKVEQLNKMFRSLPNQYRDGLAEQWREWEDSQSYEWPDEIEEVANE